MKPSRQVEINLEGLDLGDTHAFASPAEFSSACLFVGVFLFRMAASTSDLHSAGSAAIAEDRGVEKGIMVP